MARINLLGYGKIMQAMAKKLAPCDIYDDKFSEISFDEFGNRLLPSKEIIKSAESNKNKSVRSTPKKSFCYFWLLPKVESLLPYQPQLTKRGNFVESNASFLLDSSLDSALPSPSNSLDSFRKKGCTPLHSPPTRQKAAAFSLLGGVPRLSVSSKKSAGGTSAPLIPIFLHHETGEFSGANARLKNRFCFAESKSFCYFWRNFAKSRIPLNFKDSNNQRFHNSAD